MEKRIAKASKVPFYHGKKMENGNSTADEKHGVL